MGRDNEKRTSKFLSYVLRHRPDEIGLELDPQGWADVEGLIALANEAGVALTRELLDHVVATNSKKRFAFSPDGRRIRASQGHSIDVDLSLEPVVPPEHLYHGTATRYLLPIRREGLRSMSRRHVHLSGDRETAVAVGSRHGVPSVLTVRSAAMHEEGFAFYRSENGVWLVERVPASFIIFE